MSDVPRYDPPRYKKSEQALLPFDRTAARAIGSAQAAPAPAIVAADLPVYDFRGFADAARASALRTLCDGFASALATALGEHLGTDTKVSVASLEPVPYADFLVSLSHPTCLSVLRFDPPGAQGLLDLSPCAVFPMIDRLLGGRTHVQAAIPARGLTQIEQGLALQIIERAARALADSWGKTPGGALEVREEEFFADPRQARIMPGDEVVTVLRLRAEFAGCAGTISLCVPAPVTDLLTCGSASLAGATVGSSERAPDGQALQKNIMQAAVELRALLAETKVRLSDVISMQIGDIITTESPPDSEVRVHVEGQELLFGRLGQFRGTRAIQITRVGKSDVPANDHLAKDRSEDGGPVGS